MAGREILSADGAKNFKNPLCITNTQHQDNLGALQNTPSKKHIGQLRKELADVPFYARISFFDEM